MSAYETVIGLEVHVHLCTKSKLFCSCPTTFGVEPNTNVCEVCAGMPGVLPVLNQTAVEYATRAGLALDCTINNDSVFARKNYFYPDMPYNYQISQFERPLCEFGHLDINVGGETKRIGITRIHMETDAGKNIHEGDHSYLDLNRAAVPLIEIVSEPDMRSAEEAVAYLKALHAIVVYLGITDGNMEEGSFRCDANVSIRPKGAAEFGTRAELKNLNSFRHVQKAIEYEVSRQQDVLEDGDKVIQETRLFDSVKGVTMSMRDKEEAHDYRYFPDPDLVPVHITDEQLESWKASLPELPAQRRRRFMDEWKLPEQDADIITSDRAQADLFEAAVALYNEPRKIANYMTGPMLREINQTGVELKDSALKPEALAELAKIVDGGLISAKIAQDIFSELYANGVMPEAYVREKGLVQVSDTSAIDAAVDAVNEEADSPETFSLTDAQYDTLRQGIDDGAYAAAYSVSTLGSLRRLNSLLAKLTDLVETNDIAGFVDIYQQACDLYSGISDKLPEALKKLYDALVRITELENMKDLVICLNKLSTATRGFGLYTITSENGKLTLDTLTRDGFGDPFNHGLRAFAVNDEQGWMVIGTANPFMGTQLWRTTVDMTDPMDRFTDLDPNGWAYPSIEYCVRHGLMSGMSDTIFSPNTVTTRAQLVQVLYNFEGKPDVSDVAVPFTDAASGWYRDAVAWAYKTGVVDGMSPTTFAPNNTVTREQVAVILMRYLTKVCGVERTWTPDFFPSSFSLDVISII